MMVELRQLRYFVAVAEELHFGRAAERIHMAQPPLSQAIQRLEGQLGVQLFRRTNRHVALTDAGIVLLDEARQILARVEHAVDATQQARNGEIGRLSLGFVGSAAYQALPCIVRAFRARYPAVELALLQLTSPEQVRALHEYHIDVGLVRQPIANEGLAVETIQREPCFVALPQTHPLADQPCVSLIALAAEPFVLPTYGAGTDSRYTAGDIRTLCRAAGFEPLVVQEAVEIPTVVGLVAAGLGVSLVPACVQYLRLEGVVYRPLEEAIGGWEMALVYRCNEPVSAVIHSFLSVARAAMRVMPASPVVPSPPYSSPLPP